MAIFVQSKRCRVIQSIVPKWPILEITRASTFAGNRLDYFFSQIEQPDAIVIGVCYNYIILLILRCLCRIFSYKVYLL